MNITNFFSFLNNSKVNQTSESARQMCPNCWGYQDYDRQIVSLFNTSRVDWVSNSKRGFIQEFVENHVEGKPNSNPGNSICTIC